jgi:hypothetical protein
VRLLRLLVFSLSLGMAVGQSVRLPRFEDFRVSSVYRGRVTPPKVGNLNQYSGTDLRCFGGNPGQYAQEKANFAGHFVIGTCTCGSGCHYLFMWDAVTGKLHSHFPFGAINVGPYGVGGADPAVEYKGEQYRVDSSLLIVEACIEGTCDCAARYYTWSGNQFKLILKQPTRMPSNCVK